MIGAIALRESAGYPAAYNGNAATGDDSYGLTQINWKVPGIVASLATIGITKKEQLFDAAMQMLRKTGNIALAKELLGHADIRSTLVYAHVLKSDLRAALLRNSPEPPAPADAKKLKA